MPEYAEAASAYTPAARQVDRERAGAATAIKEADHGVGADSSLTVGAARFPDKPETYWCRSKCANGLIGGQMNPQITFTPCVVC